jgi:hypothetical protein
VAALTPPEEDMSPVLNHLTTAQGAIH